MKKLPILLFAAALLFMSAIPQATVKKNAAEANRYENYYIFIQSKPVADYTVIGSVKKTGVVWTGSPEEMFNTIMKRVKKEFPDCEGVIFEDITLERASCIKFKAE